MKLYEKQLSLYKYNKITGYWNYATTVTEENKDEPDEYFVVSKNRPSKPPKIKSKWESIKLKVGQKVLSEDGAIYEIENGDYLQVPTL